MPSQLQINGPITQGAVSIQVLWKQMGVFPKEKEQRDELSEVVLGHLIASVENLTNFIDLHFL